MRREKMFRCQNCGSNIGPRVSPVKIVTEKRPQTYTNSAGYLVRGWEIVREAQVCQACNKAIEEIES